MVLKNVPEIFGKHLNREIGSPQDYSKNLEAGEFANSYDLNIPRAETGDDLNDDDLAGALGEMDLRDSRGKHNNMRNSYHD